MPKNISILYDGTWNTPDKNPEVDGDSSTNVWKLYEALAAVDENGTPQAKWYQTGVGTKWYNKLRGGTFGVGLSKKIQEATGNSPSCTRRAIASISLASVAAPTQPGVWSG